MESHIGCDDIEFWTRDDENFLEFGDESLAFQSPRKVPSILTSGLGKFQCEMSVDIPCGRYFSAVDEDDIPFSVHPFSNGKRILYMVCRGQTFTHREERQVVNFVFFRGGGQLPPELLARESTPGAPHEAARNGEESSHGLHFMETAIRERGGRLLEGGDHRRRSGDLGILKGGIQGGGRARVSGPEGGARVR